VDVNLEHVKAIAVAGTSVKVVVDGVELWSNGHILIPATIEGAKELPSIEKVWRDVAAREDILMTPGARRVSRDRYYRELKSSESPAIESMVDESYLMVLSADGADAYCIGPKDPIAFRKDGKLVGVAMPVTPGSGEITNRADAPTEAELLSPFACAENGWYMQGAQVLRKELHELEEEIEAKQERVDEMESQIRSMERQSESLRDRIKKTTDSLAQGGRQNAAAGKDS
jgi:hypothetical protein